MRFIRWLSAALMVLAAPFFGTPPPAYGQSSTSGHVEWQGWSLDYAVTDLAEGLTLTDVSYQGVLILAKASFPIMRVFYENDVCGPYADRLAVPLTPVSWANDALVVRRTFVQNGQTWLELGIQDTIGNYVIYQVWYLREDGVMDAHLFGKGLQCNFFHTHYPYWRLDFDLDDNQNDQLRMYTETGWQTHTKEFNTPAADALDHRWQARDRITGLSVDILFDDNSWGVDLAGNVVPEQQYSNNLVLGRRYHEDEDIGWRYSVRSELPYRDREDMDGQDVILWYKAYMPHSPEEGQDLWHSTGIRLVINGASPPDGPSPGANDYCTVNGPCGAGEGDCDGNHECQAGLVCRNDVGATYGFRAVVDVCVAPE